MTQENTLRTLKDFDDQHCSGCECMGDECKTIAVGDLRAEAIKWINELQTRLLPHIEYERWKKERIIGSSNPEYSAEHREELDKISFKHDNEMIWIEIRKKEGMIFWIKHFFDISDEELK